VRIRTIHAVVYSASPEMVRTGSVDKDGRVQFSPKVEMHKPGTVLEIDDLAVVSRLREAGAVEILDEGYEELIEAADAVLREERRGASSAAPMPENGSQPKYPSETWSLGTDDPL
jgi:hypothetical protein